MSRTQGTGFAWNSLGTESNRSAIGTAVDVHLGDRSLHRQAQGGWKLCLDE